MPFIVTACLPDCQRLHFTIYFIKMFELYISRVKLLIENLKVRFTMVEYISTYLSLEDLTSF